MPVELTVEIRNAKLVRKGLQDLGQEIPKVGRQDVYDVLMNIRRKMAAEPGVFRGEFEWPEENKRAVAARVILDLFSGKIQIPYRRTHRYKRSWRVRRHGTEGWRLFSVSPYAQFVAGGPMGEPQASVHRDRWAHFRSVIEEDLQALPENMRRHFAKVARGLGFSWADSGGFKVW